MRNSLDQQFTFAGTAINNALTNHSIKNALAEFGYDDVKLREGLSIFQKANELHMKQIKEYGDQYTATDAVNVAREALSALYMKHLKIARISFRSERGIYQELQMAGKRSITHSGFINQVDAFYSNAVNNSKVVKGLSAFGIGKDQLQEGLKLLNDMRAKYRIQLKEMGEAQSATDARNKAIEDMSRWFSDFTSISRIALEENPQHLEMLGIVVK